jgi:hypothetical protein
VPSPADPGQAGGSGGSSPRASSSPVAYIAGAARSGSTLLERILACVPGFCSVGEMVFIWERGLRRNDRCGCGERFLECPFWTEVGIRAFGGWDQVDSGEAIALRRAVDRHRHLPRLAAHGHHHGSLGSAISQYRSLTGRLYQGVRDVSGADVIVDSSKHVGYALVLRDTPGVDLRLIHMIRRSHGVAYSWTKRVVKPGVGDGEYMSVHGTSWTIGLWLTDNLLFDLASRGMTGSARLKYESLVADPVSQVRRVLTDLGLGASDLSLSFLSDSAAALPASHALSGNPMRFQRGQIALRADEDWREAMSRPRKVVISLATWPLLRRYGYSLSTRRLSSS